MVIFDSGGKKVCEGVIDGWWGFCDFGLVEKVCMDCWLGRFLVGWM